MKNVKCLKTLVFCLFILKSPSAFSAEEEPLDSSDTLKMSAFQVNHQYDRTEFLIGTELMTLKVKSSGSDLKGIGARLGVDYALDSRWSINPNLALVYDASSQGSYLYSGITGLLRFNWNHNNMLPKQEISYEGRALYSQSNSRAAKFVTFLGIEQLFLNGSANVYPAAGVTGGLSYIDSYFGAWTEISLRTSALTAKNEPLTAMYLNISFLFGM